MSQRRGAEACPCLTLSVCLSVSGSRQLLDGRDPKDRGLLTTWCFDAVLPSAWGLRGLWRYLKVGAGRKLKAFLFTSGGFLLTERVDHVAVLPESGKVLRSEERWLSGLLLAPFPPLPAGLRSSTVPPRGHAGRIDPPPGVGNRSLDFVQEGRPEGEQRGKAPFPRWPLIRKARTLIPS